MYIKGKVVAVGKVESGISQRNGNEWKSQDFILEYYENPTDRYPNRVALRLRNGLIDDLAIREGDELEVGVGHSVWEYNGKWYNELRVFSAKKVEEPAKEESSFLQQEPSDTAYPNPF